MEQVEVAELHARLKRGAGPDVLDVREAWEVEIACLEGSLHIPMNEVPARLHELDPGRAVAVICHHGMRSFHVARFLEQQGFSQVMNVAGGIDAWARHIDGAMARY